MQRQEPMEPQGGFEPFRQVVPLEQSLHGRRIDLAPEVAPSGHDSAAVFWANHLDQVAAELPKRGGILDDQPPAV